MLKKKQNKTLSKQRYRFFIFFNEWKKTKKKKKPFAISLKIFYIEGGKCASFLSSAKAYKALL